MSLAGLALEAAALDRADFAGQTSSEVRVDGCRLTHAEFSESNMNHVLLQDVVVSGGSWANVRVREMRMRRASFTGVRLTGATLSAAAIEDVLFTDCRIDLASFRSAKLTRVRFERCRLDEVDFGGAKLASVAFVDSTLVRALWTDATLSRCEMRGTDLTGAGNPERLRGVRMPWQDVLASAAVLAAAVGIEIVE
jgi:uncharacterized protein YjbI with pentapeptide repeats